MDWGDDGTILFTDKDGGLSRIAAAGGTPQALTKPDAKKGETAHGDPRILPGGRAVLFTVFSGPYPNDPRRLVALDLATGRQHIVVTDGNRGRYVRSGHLVYARRGTLFAAPFDAKRLVVTGPETPVVEDVRYYSVTDSGLLVYTPEWAIHLSTLEWADRKGARQPVPAPVRYYSQPSLSPDGGRVAVAIRDNGVDPRSGNDIWIYDFARGTLTRVTHEGSNSFPVWTPDGRRITFQSAAKGKPGIYWVPADGSAPPELLTEGNDIQPSWTRDGKTLLFARRDESKIFHIWLRPAPGSGGDTQPHEFFHSAFREAGPQVSPDGQWIAYLSNESGKSNLYIREFHGAGGRVLVSSNNAGEFRWSRSGRELIYKEGRLFQPDLYYAAEIEPGPPLRISPPRELFQEKDTGDVLGFDISPDGERLLLAKLALMDEKLQFVENWFEELRRRVPVKK